jgi:hypothetical protein
MQLTVAGDSSFSGIGGAGGLSNADLSLLWPSNSSDDVIRCAGMPCARRAVLY